MNKISAKIDQLIQHPKAMKILAGFDKVFSQAPHLPMGLVNFLVAIIPWLAGLSAIIGLLAGPLSGLIGLLSFLTLRPLVILSYVVSALAMILNTFLMFKAFKPLKTKNIRGWIYLFWSSFLWLIEGMVNVVVSQQGLISLVIAYVINFYLLFEIKRGMVKEESAPAPTSV